MEAARQQREKEMQEKALEFTKKQNEKAERMLEMHHEAQSRALKAVAEKEKRDLDAKKDEDCKAKQQNVEDKMAAQYLDQYVGPQPLLGSC